MTLSSKSLFRSQAALICVGATDIVITACGVIYTIESLYYRRSDPEVAAGLALTVAGLSMGAAVIRNLTRRRGQPSSPRNG